MFCTLLALGAVLGGSWELRAVEVMPIAFDQTATTVNLQSQRGVPITSSVNTNMGSDGRLSAINSSYNSVNPATTNQFRGLLSFGGVTAPTNWLAVSNSALLRSGTNAFSYQVAAAMLLPVGRTNGSEDNSICMVLRRGEVGAPYLSRQVSFPFGSIIPVPLTDERGVLLTNVAPESYWLPEPWSASNHTNDQYYWSPNAETVFSVQSGPIFVTWRKATAYQLAYPPAYTNLNGTASFETNGANLVLLYTVPYVVSGNAVKTPQKMFWTEGSFQKLGYSVSVPAARVSAIHVVYNPSFPVKVTTPYADPNYVGQVDPTNMLQEFRTLWFDSALGQIHAYNAEGRVFVELLGLPRAEGGSEYLGFEIVDVSKAPAAVDLAAELGERLGAYQDGSDDSMLAPWPIDNSLGTQYYYRQNLASGLVALYADRATEDLNDLQTHWLISGVAGLQWSYRFVRYTIDWPSDPAKYSHYLRPLVATDAEAQLTAVQLSGTEAPTLDYQDPLDQPRAKLTASFAYYTFLDQDHPAHRGLLRFISGDEVRFERVFSWLDVGLTNQVLLSNSVAATLSAWNASNATLVFTSPFTAPYVTNATVSVGDRILAPAGELGASNTYWAGYIRQTNGTSFYPGAYVDPFVAGFDQANLGAIIPVNAIPGQNRLEVWWFRKNNADSALGFQPVYWPSVIGHYTLQWPANASEIVLAGNNGSGALDSLQARGVIYSQNDPTQPGYNPNEEHALMLGGQAYALRDDLNITNGVNYSSAPYVLLAYTAADGRPAMKPFHVRREAPEAGQVFDYVMEAGTLLQAPMPLPLLAAPLEGTGASAINYNTEPPSTSGDLPVGWNSGRDGSGPYSTYPRFTFEDRNHAFWVYRGLHAGLPLLEAGRYTNNAFGTLPPGTAVLNQSFSYFVHVSRRLDSLTVSATNLPSGLFFQTSSNGLVISGTPTALCTNSVTLRIQDTGDNSLVTNSLSIRVATNGSSLVTQGPLVIVSSNQYSGTVVSFTNRPPQLAASPTTNNCFTMRYYYKTLASFAWPGLSNAPAVGSIVPYLRPPNSTDDAANKTTRSLNIVYRPVWPATVPTLNAAQTLTEAASGLPAVRGQSSLQVLYQQSIATNITVAPASVVLFDPTVRKTSSLAALNGLPSSVLANSYQGKMYFPTNPPNLINRLYYDPSTTNLVLEGQFVNEVVGEKYLLLNVLAGADLACALGICPATDAHKSAWDAAIRNLSTPVYTFHEDPSVPGSYVADPNQTVYRTATNIVEVNSSDTQVDSYALSATGPGQGYVSYIVGNGRNPVHASDLVSIYIVRITPPLYQGQIKVIEAPSPLSEMITFQHTADLAGRSAVYAYDWRIMPPVDGQPPISDKGTWTVLAQGTDLTHVTLGGAGIQALCDNYITMRYRCADPLANPALTNWSDWTVSQLAEGWIKRVLAGINPFNQRTKDLFDNPANTTASIISQAGHRWEGDVPLNQDALANAGLIEIYETVLNRGKMLSINSGYNYGPANDALLLAAGYLNDLYMMLGNEAWADAANPTIGIGTADKTYGSIATALFAFKGQVASLLEEEMGLLRGRDDFLATGTSLNPVYNRLYWNYTRGIDAGEVIYALNYNILDENQDGVVNAADAAFMYPQGHGDAYGHYLTALKNYYLLLTNPNFSWVPRAEAVTVLGATVAVDYQDERKFAAAAAAVARAGRQVLDLTWRQNYQPGTSGGWGYFATNRVNSQRTYVAGGVTKNVTRYWGLDHWASRVGQGTSLNWVVGNSILPPVDPDPTHEGIQKVDRTTVAELQELPQTAAALENDLDNANAGFTPLGLSQNSIPFDINPLQVTGANPQTHFEQIYDRAVGALNNAVVAFNDAQNVTQTMRTEEDSLFDFQASITAQELAYNNQLIELYGTPYTDDLGTGQTYPQDYTGPDLIHYTYVENPDTNNYNGILADSTVSQTFQVDIQQLPSDWLTTMYQDFDWVVSATNTNKYLEGSQYISFNIGPNGFFDKPSSWTGQRISPGSIQQAISALIAAQNQLREEMYDATYDKYLFDKAVNVFTALSDASAANSVLQDNIFDRQQHMADIQTGYDIDDKWLSLIAGTIGDQLSIIQTGVPESAIFGFAFGGDEGKVFKTPLFTTLDILKEGLLTLDTIHFTVLQSALQTAQRKITEWSKELNDNGVDSNLKDAVNTLAAQLGTVQGHLGKINQYQRNLDDTQRAYRALVAKGNRIQQERLTFRQHAAAVVQGYRTRDAAFRVFQNEKLERYKTLFDMAAQYAYLAAQAYDYETGLLNTDQGRSFLNRIISARALGVIVNGTPQYAGSDTGDPGLSSALAEMKADWDVLKGRLGFNNPDGYGTTVSLRSENYRILPGADGINNWQDVLKLGRTANLLADSDVKRYCMQIDDGSGLPVPGIVLSFSTVIADGLNLFGQQLGPGDHNFSPSSFATKIFSVGVDIDGYVGMDNPAANSGAGGTSPTDPTTDPNGLAATPYVYLIPVGADSMRSPPLGDVSTIRTWNVDDLTIPLPFNISAADFSATPFYTSADSLSEPLFSVRKHQAFRPVSTASVFNTSIYGANGALQPSQYTNKRLIGRSVWNSKWKLVIPGKTLLADPKQGLDRFIASVTDVKLYFITYSYSGN